jgi:hypothetical protein
VSSRTRHQAPSSRTRTRTRRSTRTEMREVRAADPGLSPEVNAELTEELREVVGAERVEVPVDRPHATRGELPPKQSLSAYLSQNRFNVLRATAIMLTFGLIVSLASRDWWLLPIAAGVHAIATMAVTLTIVRMTTVAEHPSPEVAAGMAAEGVRSPDERFSQMVEEFGPIEQGGAGEVLSPGHNERSVAAGADPVRAAAEQSSAMTPTEDPSRPAGEGGAPDYIIWTTALALLALSIILPPFTGGGWMWLLTAIMVPLIAGWVAVQWLVIARPERVSLRGGGRLTGVAIGVAVAVTVAMAGLCAVVAFAFHH